MKAEKWSRKKEMSDTKERMEKKEDMNAHSPARSKKNNKRIKVKSGYTLCLMCSTPSHTFKSYCATYVQII